MMQLSGSRYENTRRFWSMGTFVVYLVTLCLSENLTAVLAKGGRGGGRRKGGVNSLSRMFCRSGNDKCASSFVVLTILAPVMALGMLMTCSYFVFCVKKSDRAIFNAEAQKVRRRVRRGCSSQSQEKRNVGAPIAPVDGTYRLEDGTTSREVSLLFTPNGDGSFRIHGSLSEGNIREGMIHRSGCLYWVEEKPVNCQQQHQSNDLRVLVQGEYDSSTCLFENMTWWTGPDREGCYHTVSRMYPVG